MVKQVVGEDVEKLIQAPSVCAEVAAAGERYLEIVGTADEAAAREALVGELREDVYSIDDLIAFTFSPDGEVAFGKEAAATTKTAVEATKVNGEPSCLCDTCQAGTRTLREAGEV